MRIDTLTRKKLLHTIAQDIEPFVRQQVKNKKINQYQCDRIKEVMSIFVETLVDSIVEVVEGKETDTFFDSEDEDAITKLLEEDLDDDEIDVYDDAA